MVTEGYIPYLRKWIKLQDSPKAKTKADQGVSEVHSDIQRLAPGGSLEVGDLQKLAKPDDTTRPFGGKNKRLARQATNP